jgi:tetratricopeptide (TPR) repeat protein
MKRTTLCLSAFLFAIHLMGATPQEEFSAASDALFSAQNPSVEMHLRLADAAVAIGMSTIAIPIYERVINLGSDTAATRLKLANCYERVGMYTDARDMYRMVLKMKPDEELRDTAAAKSKEMSRLITPVWAVSGKITAALFYDSNVNYAPDSASLPLGWFPGMPLGETARESAGASLAGSIDAAYQLPDSDWSLFTRANLYSYNVEAGHSYGLYYGSLTLGPRLRMDRAALDLPLQVDYFGRGGINKFFSYGFMPAYSYMQSKTLGHTLRLGVESRYYLNVPDKNRYRQDAMFYSLHYAVRKSFETIPLGVTLSARPGYEYTDMIGFDGFHLETSAMLDYKVTQTITVYGGLLGYWGLYQDEMPGQTKNRNDEQIEGVIGIQKAWWNRWTTDLSYRYRDSQSSIADFIYDRHVVTLSLSYSF